MSKELLLIDSKNVYHKVFNSVNPNAGPNSRNVLSKNVFTMVKVPDEEYVTYNYRVDLNDTYRDVLEIRLVDYTISMPEMGLFNSQSRSLYFNSLGFVSKNENGKFYNVKIYDNNGTNTGTVHTNLLADISNTIGGHNVLTISITNYTDSGFGSSGGEIKFTVDGNDYVFLNPTIMRPKDEPCILLKINDYEVVKHPRIKNIFRAISFKDLSDRNISNSVFRMSNNNSSINSINIELKGLDDEYLTGLDDGTGNNKYHNSFLFEIKTKNN